MLKLNTVIERFHQRVENQLEQVSSMLTQIQTQLCDNMQQTQLEWAELQEEISKALKEQEQALKDQEERMESEYQEKVYTLSETMKEREQALETKHKEEVRRLEKQHDQEINDKQTLGLKMSMIQEYDKKYNDLQRELDYCRKKLAQTQVSSAVLTSDQSTTPQKPVLSIKTIKQTSKEPPPVEPTTKSIAEPTEESTVEPTEPIEPTADPIAESTVEPTKPVEPVEPTEEPVVQSVSKSEPAEPAAPVEPKQETVPKTIKEPEPTTTIKKTVAARRRVKWRENIYYYDAETLEVFESLKGGTPVGRKEEKKIVLF